MTEKIFTQQHYEMIVKSAENDRTIFKTGLFDELVKTDFKNDFGLGERINEILAIANPLAREWAKEQFVKKENKYVWISKKKDDCGDSLRLAWNSFSVIVLRDSEGDLFTESEIKEWGYNPDMFDKELVED